MDRGCGSEPLANRRTGMDQIDIPITRVTADGAYDGCPTYATIAEYGEDIKVVIPHVQRPY
jgi:hypothetical protein